MMKNLTLAKQRFWIVKPSGVGMSRQKTAELQVTGALKCLNGMIVMAKTPPASNETNQAAMHVMRPLARSSICHHRILSGEGIMKSLLLTAALLMLCISRAMAQPVEIPLESAEPHIATFSIVAFDPDTGDYGVAVQSRYFAVGEVVPHASAETGAIATQARGNLLYGVEGLKLLAEGMHANEVIAQLVKTDPLRSERQVGVVDQYGVGASYTGKDCLPWAGGRTGSNYAVQGNLLAGPQVVDAMATAFETSNADFASRLIQAIAAGQAAGGDARGRQSAALLVVRKNGGYLGLTDRYIDLHVEDDPTPIRELDRLLQIRLAQLATAKAKQQLQQADGAEPAARAELISQARQQVEQAVRMHPADDYGWWLLARIHLIQGQQQAAADAAQRALLENPAWRRLPASTRSILGVEPELIEELLQVDSFQRIWKSLATEGAVSP
jgi:uncharacterized Ntn-hydrolase superfamily protein